MKDKVINLTQHPATPAQVEAGVVDPSDADKKALQRLLTFDSPPNREEMVRRARAIARIAFGYKKAMIGGAPFFMSTLEKTLKSYGIRPVYAFSKRESVERKDDDGSVIKTQVFRHLGFVEI